MNQHLVTYYYHLGDQAQACGYGDFAMDFYAIAQSYEGD
jgi:hypothetical protein